MGVIKFTLGSDTFTLSQGKDPVLGSAKANRMDGLEITAIEN